MKTYGSLGGNRGCNISADDPSETGGETMKALKIGIIAVVAIIAVTLITLRITGLEPQYLDLNQLRAHHMIARPGLWLKGQLVTVPVTDWSFVNDVKDPGQSPQHDPGGNANALS